MTKVSIDSNVPKNLTFEDLSCGDFFTLNSKMYIKVFLNGVYFATNLISGVVLDHSSFTGHTVVKHDAVEIKVTE
jgi:hypothetical protein